MRTNRVCKICGKAYYYCVSCDEAQRGQKGYEPWHILVHDDNCLRIFTTLQNHFINKISDEEAREILNSCDLSVVENASDSIKKQVNDIVDREAPTVVEEPATEEVKKPIRKPRAKKVDVEN